MEGNVAGQPSTYKAMYHAYRITNDDGVDYPNLFVALENIVGDLYIQLGQFEDGVASTGPLANGASKVVYFYLQGTAAAPGQTDSHTVSVYPSKPFTTPLVSTNFSVAAEDTIVAKSNKVLTVTYAPAQPDLGGELTMTITGETGTIGSPPIFAYTPASELSWPSNSFELTNAQLVIPNVVDQSNTLIWTATNTANMAYTITYTFRVVCASEGTAISMLNHIQSGQQNKHNAPDALPVAPVPPPTTSPVIIYDRQPATANVPQAGGTITHNIYFRNDGFRTITFEDIIDALGEGPLDPNTNLPARGTYVPGSTRLDDVPTTLEPVYSATLHELRWSSSFSLAPAGELVISFDIEYPPIAGNYPHAARAEIAGGSEGSGLGTACGGAGDVTQIDTTYDLSDDIPSTATISVASPNTAPTQADATVVLAVGDVLATYGVEPDHSDPESDPIGTVTIDAATGGVASWDETTGLISFVPDDPDAAGTWTVSYEVCDTGDPVLCDTATLTLLWNDPPVLEDLSLGSGLDPVLSWGAETTFALGDYVLGTGLVMADDPDDGDTDGLATISVGATASGPFGATADVGSGASCAAATDGTVTLTAGTTSGVTECFVQVCEELPFNDVRVCAVTSMGFTVVECQSTNECSTGLVCDLTDNTCVECIDDTECSGVNDRCDATTRTCVACLDATDCNDSNECTLDQCTDNVCANPSVDAGTECTTGVCDGATTDPSCIDCYVTADPDDVDPGCLTATPECLEDPLSGDLTCVECKRDEDCQGEEVCNLVFHSCVDPDALSAEDDGYLIQVGASLVVSTAAEGLLANDSVPPSAEVTLEVVAASAPDPVTEGTLAVNQDGTFSFVPVEGFVGTVVFTYELTTPLAGFATADVTLKVNGGPVAEDDTAEVDEDGSVVIAVLDNDSDPNGDALEVTAVTGGPSHGTVQVNADGTISYTPSTNYNGPDTFTYRVCDIHDVCDTAAVSITVNPVNDAPVGRDDYGLTPRGHAHPHRRARERFRRRGRPPLGRRHPTGAPLR